MPQHRIIKTKKKRGKHRPMVNLQRTVLTDEERAIVAKNVLEMAQKQADKSPSGYISSQEIILLMVNEGIIEKTTVVGKKLPTMPELSKMLKDWRSLK